MQVYAPPDDVKVPDFDEAFVNGRYDMNKDDEIHKAFFERLKKKLREEGYTGPLTGEIVRFPIADGAAQYMVADRPRGMVLIHLPIHDAWSIPEAHARGLRKADIVKLVEGERAWRELFAKKKP